MLAPVADRVTDRAADRQALRGLRAGRRAERLRHVDWIDALYRAYMIGLGTIAALMGLAFAVADTRLRTSTIDAWRLHGPAVVGIVAAAAAALGLRSGSHGGPLVFEAADVQHVLLSPVDRGVVVRATATRQLRGVVAIGALVGSILGVTVADRIPAGFDGTIGPWLLSGAAAGVLIALTRGRPRSSPRGSGSVASPRPSTGSRWWAGRCWTSSPAPRRPRSPTPARSRWRPSRPSTWWGSWWCSHC